MADSGLLAPEDMENLQGFSFFTRCVECDNDTFMVELFGLPNSAAQVSGVKCAVCGQRTKFRSRTNSKDLADA
tara:strand:+ start:59 stop:277 length:219 start_codon:yes stop_codon:yes gene_type:complete